MFCTPIKIHKFSLSLSLIYHPSTKLSSLFLLLFLFLSPLICGMRIRKRAALSSSSYPYLTSPTPPPQSLVPDPGLQAPSGGGVDGAKGEGNGGGKAAEELHQVGDLKIDHHVLGEDLPRTSSLHHPHPRLHLARAGQVQQATKEEEEREEEEEDEIKMDWSKKWHPQINSNESGSSSALVQASPSMQKIKASYGANGDEDDAGWSKKARDKERKTKATPTKARAKAGATSVAAGNNCTSSVNGSDNEGCNIGGAPAAAFKEQDKGSSSSGGGGAAAAAAAINANGSASGKRRRSPAVLMEGSRCSRVNGRGWRCCQQTLVGYSLCEHHLGKGRLRSMSSVRGQIGATTRPKKNAEGGTTGASGSVSAMAATHSPEPQGHDEMRRKQQQQLMGSNNVKKKETTKREEDNDEDEEEEEEETAGRKKRKKIGMVKARSISSLLDAVDHVTSSKMAPPEVALAPRFTAGAVTAAAKN